MTISELFIRLACLPGMYRIKLPDSATPVVYSPRKIPVPQREKVLEELKRIEKLGVIVRQEEPTEWVNSLVVVQKPNRSVRLCIDPSRCQYFQHSRCQRRLLPVKVEDEPSLLYTFNTPIGRYKFTRLPFGVKCALEIFQRTMDQMIEEMVVLRS